MALVTFAQLVPVMHKCSTWALHATLVAGKINIRVLADDIPQRRDQGFIFNVELAAGSLVLTVWI